MQKFTSIFLALASSIGNLNARPIPDPLNYKQGYENDYQESKPENKSLSQYVDDLNKLRLNDIYSQLNHHYQNLIPDSHTSLTQSETMSLPSSFHQPVAYSVASQPASIQHFSQPATQIIQQNSSPSIHQPQVVSIASQPSSQHFSQISNPQVTLSQRSPMPQTVLQQPIGVSQTVRPVQTVAQQPFMVSQTVHQPQTVVQQPAIISEPIVHQFDDQSTALSQLDVSQPFVSQVHDSMVSHIQHAPNDSSNRKNPYSSVVTPENFMARSGPIIDNLSQLVQNGVDEHDTFETSVTNTVNNEENDGDTEMSLINNSIDAIDDLIKFESFPSSSNIKIGEHIFEDNMQDSKFIHHISPKYYLVSGYDYLEDMSYYIDGNYKLMLRISSRLPVKFTNKEFHFGDCGMLTPGLFFINDETYSVTLTIDLSICKQHYVKTSDTDSPTSENTGTLAGLNLPIDIKFEVCDPTQAKFDIYVCSHYHFNDIHADFQEDYIVEMDTQNHVISTYDLDNHNLDQNPLQFNYHAYTDETYTTRLDSDVLNTNVGDEEKSYFQIEPANGFNPAEMIYVPEICLVTNFAGEHKVLWDLGNVVNKNKNTCYDGLRYNFNQGTWQFSEKVLPGEIVTCDMRLCANVPGNLCQNVVETCDYSI